MANTTTPFFAVCQAGYDLRFEKTAVRVTRGDTAAGGAFSVLREADRAVVATGELVPFRPEGWTRGETYALADFSSVCREGRYLLQCGHGESEVFEISDNRWQRLIPDVLGYYRMQRCGTDTRDALPAHGFPNRPSPEALHGPCHLDDARVGTPEGPSADCTGGWHDAGDNNKYSSQFGWLAAAFVSTWERYDGASFDLDRNGVPDLLDEARVAAEYLLKVQAATGVGGGILDQVQNHANACVWLYPEDETKGIRGDGDDRVLEPRVTQRNPNPTAMSYDTAMKAAAGLAAVAGAFAGRDDRFAGACRTGAEQAYQWAMGNTDKTRGSYCTDVQAYARLHAAVRLFLLTGGEVYREFADTYIDTCESLSLRGTNYWGAEPLALADYFPVAGERQEKIVKLLTKATEAWIDSLAMPFGVSSAITTCDFGINEPNLSKAADAWRLYELTGNTRARDAAVRAMTWTFGVNPFGMCFVTGTGSRFPLRPHSRLDRDAETRPESTIFLPGYLMCGPIARDTLDPDSLSPWYEDRPLALDGLKQWRYNEHSVSIQFACLDLVVGMSCSRR